MTPPRRPDRASALHRRAWDRAADDDIAFRPVAAPAGDAVGAPAPARSALPGAAALVIALTGLVLGLAATGLVLKRDWDPGAVSVGSWSARPRVGTAAIDPYARAGLAVDGVVPLAANEGLLFTASTDDTGYRLLRSCDYRVGGAVPPARFWTLTATGADGRTVEAAPVRSAVTSLGVIRDIAGRFSVDLAAVARPGNWLPLAGAGPLTLSLRLYDTPLTGNPAEVALATLPSITRLSCGPASEATR